MADLDADLRKTLGSRLRAVRERRGLSQASLGEMVGVEPDSIGRMERGKRLPTLDTLARIAGELNVAIGDLVDPDRPPAATTNSMVALIAKLTPSQQELVRAVAEEFLKGSPKPDTSEVSTGEACAPEATERV